jgi:glycosyltransferase involved in cell wall biosynthesis
MAEGMTAPQAPEISFVIPIYNEEKILEEAVTTLHAALTDRRWRFEIILAENGSRDRTPELLVELGRRFAEVSHLRHPEPNYGGALREGIRTARGRYVVCEEIDLCDVDFHERALSILRAGEADMVVGSKAMHGAADSRPIGRRVATRVYNGMLRIAVGFRGTDTHGLKAFVRETLLPVVDACVVEHDVFASELVVRAHRTGLVVREIPIVVQEKRAPSIRLFQRVPKVLRHVARLMVAIHGRGEG